MQGREQHEHSTARTSSASCLATRGRRRNDALRRSERSLHPHASGSRWAGTQGTRQRCRIRHRAAADATRVGTDARRARSKPAAIRHSRTEHSGGECPGAIPAGARYSGGAYPCACHSCAGHSWTDHHHACPWRAWRCGDDSPGCDAAGRCWHCPGTGSMQPCLFWSAYEDETNGVMSASYVQRLPYSSS
jgi:hypothetical protein